MGPQLPSQAGMSGASKVTLRTKNCNSTQSVALVAHKKQGPWKRYLPRQILIPDFAVTTIHQKASTIEKSGIETSKVPDV